MTTSPDSSSQLPPKRELKRPSLRRRVERVCWVALLAFSCLAGPTAEAQTSAQVRDALFCEPGSVLLQLALADALAREGQPAAALEAIAPECVATGVPILALKRAYYLLDLGRYEPARTVLYDVLLRCPDSLDARYALVKLHGALANWAAVQATCDDIAARSPDNYFAILNGAWARFNQRDYAGALALYETPRHGHLRVMRLGQAWSKLRLGDVAAARAVFADLLKSWAVDAEALAGVRACDAAVPGSPVPTVPAITDGSAK